MKIPSGTEVGLGPGDIVLNGDSAPPGKGHSSPLSSTHVYCGQTVAPSQLLLRSLYNRKINMTFEDKIKTTYKEVTENSDASSKNLKSELKKK